VDNPAGPRVAALSAVRFEPRGSKYRIHVPARKIDGRHNVTAANALGIWVATTGRPAAT
jgi:hypothetical protein